MSCFNSPFDLSRLSRECTLTLLFRYSPSIEGVWNPFLGLSPEAMPHDECKPAFTARAMEYLLSHDAEAEAMGRRGRKAACELYNWNSEERVLLKFYSELLETDASGRKESEQMSRAVANPQSQYQGQVLGAAPYS